MALNVNKINAILLTVCFVLFYPKSTNQFQYKVTTKYQLKRINGGAIALPIFCQTFHYTFYQTA